MTLIEAIKSGRPWRRASWDRDSRWRTPPANPKEAYTERWDDLIADDWEIQEPSVTITRAQFWEAVKAVLGYDPLTLRTRDDWLDLARRLGLEEKA